MKKKSFKVSFSVLIFLVTFQVMGQSKIHGIVVDSLSKEPLYGANVFLVGTGFGAAADFDGEYSIPKIPSGNYQIKVSYVGYTSQLLNVKVNGIDDLELYFTLHPQMINGKEIVVTAQMKGQVAAMNQQISSNTMVNVVSADRIRELPDANAAESVGRLPGISLIRGAGEATKVVVRGLEPKLNSITINGIKIPSTSGGDRSVDMSMIASESLEGIEVFKAPTPDMDAEAVGGVVNLKMKKAPKEQTVRLKLDPGYNQLKNKWGDYKAAGEYSDRFFESSVGLVTTLNYEKINRSSESWSGSYSVSGIADPVTGVIPVLGNNVTMRNVIEDRSRWGGSLTLDYLFDAGSIWISNIYSSTSRNPFSVSKRFDPKTDDIIRYTVDDSEIKLSGLTNTLNGDLHLLGMDVDFVLSRYNITNDNSYEIQMIFDQGSPFDKSIVDINNLNTYIPGAKDNLAKIFLRSAYLTPDKTVQNDYTAQLNAKIPINLGSDLSAFIKFGGKYIKTDRDHISSGMGEGQYYIGGVYTSTASKYSSRGIIFNPTTTQITGENFVGSPSDYVNIVNGDYRLFPIFDRNIINQWGKEQQPTFKDDRNYLANNYNVIEKVTAGYIMGQLNLGQLITIIPGIRYESSNNWYKSIWSSVNEIYGRTGTQKDTSYTKTYEYLFPHLHIKIKPSEWFDLKLSANKSIARPDYSWVVPFTKFDMGSQKISRGNPDLIETKAWNYNVTASVYNNIFGYFAVSGFSKILQDVSYTVQTQVYKPEDIVKLGIPNREQGYQLNSYANSPNAKIWGAEFELQTQLALISGIPDFLKGLVFNANYARIWSETSFPKYTFVTSVIPGSRPPKFNYTLLESERTGPLPGQAKEIINFSLGYDLGSLSLRLSMLYQGGSINSVGDIAEQDTWNDAFTRWDLTIKYKATNWINVHMNLMNISNQPDRAFFGSETYPTNRYYYGMTASAGLEVTL